MHTARKLAASSVEELLYREFGDTLFVSQSCADQIPTLWVDRENILAVLTFLKPHFCILYDLFGIDERTRSCRDNQPTADYTVVYQLLSMRRNEDLRIKVGLSESDLNLPTCVAIWPNANWYEREAWDMFGVTFCGHPNLFRILLPPTWEGHALRKDCLLYTSPSPRDVEESRMPSSA